jgi:hypothetical protein
MGDEDLEWVVHEAKAQGFAVYWRNQILDTQDVNARVLPVPAATVENVLKSYDALEVFLEERGAFLQRVGVDGISLGSCYWACFPQILSPAQYVDRTHKLIKRLKAKFLGKIAYDASDDVASDPYLASAIDYFEASPWASVSDQEAISLSVPSLKAKYRQAIDSIRSAAKGKPIIWNVFSGSRDNAFSTGFLEDAFCTGGYDFGLPTLTTCLQENTKTDFSLQAIVHEAKLEAIFEYDRSNVHGVRIDYWTDDNVLPSFNFPNLSTSIRGKPAEAIVYEWFKR